jgi:hypothetical protein
MAKIRKSATKMDGRRSGKTRPWSKDDQRELKRHSKAKTRVSVISRAMKRTVGALRQQALKLGIGLGHRLASRPFGGLHAEEHGAKKAKV